MRIHFEYALSAIIILNACHSNQSNGDSSAPVHFSDGSSGWVKYEGNPVLGNAELGTCFDVNVIGEGSSAFNMYFSWRPKNSIAVSRSDDGISWSHPQIVLPENPESGWEDIVNRSCTLYWNGQYHMWYTGQKMPDFYSRIGYAVSDDGVNFKRVQEEPVLIPQYVFEGVAVMNPYVMRDEERGVFRMWYSSGEAYEPNVLCYAESRDGVHWDKSPLNPVFVHGKNGEWDADRIGGCEVHRLSDGTYALFYIGYSDINTARIGVAVSKDGIKNWKRLKANPIAEPDAGMWDGEACYKPSVVRDESRDRWMLWYNGRRGNQEYIGMLLHEGLDLGETE